MSKRVEKISKIDEQIAKLENQRKLEVQKQREEERKAQNKGTAGKARPKRQRHAPTVP